MATKFHGNIVLRPLLETVTDTEEATALQRDFSWPLGELSEEDQAMRQLPQKLFREIAQFELDRDRRIRTRQGNLLSTSERRARVRANRFALQKYLECLPLNGKQLYAKVSEVVVTLETCKERVCCGYGSYPHIREERLHQDWFYVVSMDALDHLTRLHGYRIFNYEEPDETRYLGVELHVL